MTLSAGSRLGPYEILANHDFGNQGGVTYAVMELLEGETLGQALSEGAPTVRKAADWALQIGPHRLVQQVPMPVSMVGSIP